MCAQTAVELAMSFWSEIAALQLALARRSGPVGAHSGDELAQEQGSKAGGRKEEVAPLIKSRDPHLACGEQTAKMGFHQQKF